MARTHTTRKFERCVRSVKRTVRARKGSNKKSAAIAICTKTILQKRGRTMKSYRRGRLITQKKFRGGLNIPGMPMAKATGLVSALPSKATQGLQQSVLTKVNAESVRILSARKAEARKAAKDLRTALKNEMNVAYGDLEVEKARETLQEAEDLAAESMDYNSPSVRSKIEATLSKLRGVMSSKTIANKPAAKTASTDLFSALSSIAMLLA